jgi:hypothetical protein
MSNVLVCIAPMKYGIFVHYAYSINIKIHTCMHIKSKYYLRDICKKYFLPEIQVLTSSAMF